MGELTRKIGRYEILGELATGGMAEILLARLVGPSGFERPVVIKRIRTDLEDRETLTSLFLDEARLVAKVRHANVVHVEDLGVDEEEAPYLVMEYLEGESVANLTRRLISRGDTLPFAVGAYVVAEAAAGLHAAHELRDANDRLLNVVHRDVSPQNIFVTYEGVVKVVDFGIAKSTDTAETEAGRVRGKSGYMAPEQFRAEPVDRRVDVFALGIVLWELLTGKRLFKRFSNVATMRATLEDPIVAPSRVTNGIPAALEAICAKALCRTREERYSTAAEMRRELLAAVRALLPDEPNAETSTIMRTCFADRIEDKTTLLRSVRDGTAIDHVPAGDVDVTIEVPGIEDPPTIPLAPSGTRETSGNVVVSSIASTHEARRLRHARWIVPVVFLGLIGGTVAFLRHAPGPEGFAAASATVASASPSFASVSVVPTLPSAVPATTAPLASVSARSTPPPTSSGRAAAPLAPSDRPAARRRLPDARPTVTSSAPVPAPPPSPAPAESARGFRRFQ